MGAPLRVGFELGGWSLSKMNNYRTISVAHPGWKVKTHYQPFLSIPAANWSPDIRNCFFHFFYL